jgi:C4-dicarboxylate-specific signal transduction histidine kinase
MRYARLVGEIDNVDVTQVVEDALTLLDDALKKQSVRVIKNYTQVPPAKIEKTQLIQVVVNLIKNGYEAMEEVDARERTLVLSVRRESGPPDQIVLSIKDNGMGFAPEEQQNLFRFGYTTKAKGSGFGLHASANYLIARSGSLAAHSDGHGKGAEFVMRLPIDPPGNFHGGG